MPRYEGSPVRKGGEDVTKIRQRTNMSLKVENTEYIAELEWPDFDSTFMIQGGRIGEEYFIEAFLKNSCYRGDGDSYQSAEKQCWDRWYKSYLCEHEIVQDMYWNGGGTCKKCNCFFGDHFTPEELDAYCYSCGAASYYYWFHEDTVQAIGKPIFECEDCYHNADKD